MTIVAHVSEAQSSFSGGFESWRDQPPQPIPNRTRCPAHSTGNGAIKSLTASDAGCLPLEWLLCADANQQLPFLAWPGGQCPPP